MTQIDPDVTKFMNLLEQKNMKQIKLYLNQVQKYNEVALKVVAKGLDQALVKKKTTPLGLITALNVYKQLLIRSQFQFLDEVSEKTHNFLYQTCQYNPKGPADTRGGMFFKQKMNIKINQQIETLGNSIVLMALQIVKAMAQLYPKDFFTDEKSRYVVYYEKLKQKKITFPDTENFVFMKPQQIARFQKNHEVWLKNMSQLLKQQSQTPQAPQVPQENKDTKNKVAVPPLQNPPQNTSIQQKKVPQTTQSVLPQNENKNKVPEQKIVTKSALPQNLNKPVESQKNNDKNQTSKVQQINKNLNNLNNTQKVNQNQGNPNINSSRPPKIDQSKPNLSKNNNQASVPKTTQNLFVLQQPKKSKDQPQKVIKQVIKAQQKQIKNNNATQKNIKPMPIANIKDIQKAQIIQSGLKSDRNIFESQQPSARNIQAKDIVFKQLENLQLKKQKQLVKQDPVHHRVQPRLQIPTPTISHQFSQSPNVNYGKKQVKQLARIQKRTQQPNANIIKQPMLNINQNNPDKVEKEQSYRNLNKTQKIYIQDAPKNKKSLPKTQKKYFCSLTQGIPFYDLSPQKRFKFDINNETQTLSNLRNQKNLKKVGNPQVTQFIKSQSLGFLIEKCKLNQLTIPFLPNYFKPVDAKMQALIVESLKVGSKQTFEPSKPFYKNQQLQIRLIKAQNSYLLSVHNISHLHLLIGFSHGLLKRSGDQFTTRIIVKCIQRRKNQQVTAWRLDPNQFVDIPFQFSTNDPNFRFLQFPITVNNKILTLHLPITLLDQGKIQKALNIQQISQYIQLHGRILKTPPMALYFLGRSQNYTSLPLFFHINKNKDQRMLGHMCYQVFEGNYTLAKINFYVNQVSRNPLKHQINALYDNRIQQNQNFAKVLLQLLCFLMAKH